jgi:hypothetical protein
LDVESGAMKRHVRKSKRQRLEELRQALVVIESGLQSAFQTGEEAHFLPVVGQLRALLVASGQTPLLLDLARELGFPLEFYSIPLGALDNEEMAAILGPSRIQWTGDSLGPHPQAPLLSQKVTMEAWLASTQVVVGQKKISGEELLRMVANKLGGAHYDPTVPPELAAQAPFRLGGVPSMYLTLARLGEVVLHLGRILLERHGRSATDH